MLSVVVCNVRGIILSVACLSELFHYNHCDIALICEHKLFQQSQSFLNTIDGNYTPFASADTSVNLETCRYGKGGVAILYHNNLILYSNQLDCHHSKRLIGIEFKTNTNESIFFFVYLPADNNMEEYKHGINILNDYNNQDMAT